MSLIPIVNTSERLVRVAGSLPTARAGATALALALGRVAASRGLPLDGLLDVVRIAHGGEGFPDLLPELDEESVPPAGRRH